jgi:hypothetical protein
VRGNILNLFGVPHTPLEKLHYSLTAVREAVNHEPKAENPYAHLYPLRHGQLLEFKAGLNDTQLVAKAALIFKHMHEVFHQLQNEINVKLTDWKTYLLRRCNGQEPEEEEIAGARDSIQNFHEHTSFFFNAVLARSSARVTAIFNTHFCNNCLDHIPAVQASYAIIKLQALLGEPLPLKELLDASAKKPMDKNVLGEFTKKIITEKIDISTLYDALKAIVHHGKQHHVTQADIQLNQDPQLGVLENYLYEIDSSLFSLPDPDHMAWRATLTENSALLSTLEETTRMKLEMPPCKIVLGKQIKEKNSNKTFDRNVYFEIKECCTADKTKLNENIRGIATNCVLWIPINRALPEFRLARMEYCEGMMPSKTCFIDSRGRFALVEKLYPPPSLQENEEAYRTMYVNPIAQWIKWLITKDEGKKNFTPYPLEPPQHILLNKNRTLTSVKLLYALEEFKFTPLEKFVFYISNGDRKIFKEAMTKSGLYDMKEAQILREAASDAFKMEPVNIFIEKPKDKSIFEEAKQLQNELRALLDACKLALNSKIVSEKEIEGHILNYYKESGSARLLWPSMQFDILRPYFT